MKKTILKLEVHNDKEKRKVMKRVSALAGVDSISMDMKDKKLTVIGDIDPLNLLSKLRKLCHAEIVSVGPAKEPEKKKDDGNKKKDEPKEDDVAELLKAYKAYNPMPYPYPGYGAAELFKVDTSYNPQNPPLTSAKKDPNACVIL